MTHLYNLISKYTDFGYNEELKREFKSAGTKYFKEVCRALKKKYPELNCRHSYNAGGIAVNGDISLRITTEDDSGMYCLISSGAASPSIRLMYRTIKYSEDYSGGTNNWADSTIFSDPNKLVELAQSFLNL
jgi:hypothetical protein